MLAEALRQRTQPFSSRVSFLPLSPGSAAAEEKHQVSALRPAFPDANALPEGVVAPAERVVRCDDPLLADLPGRLLGRTLIVGDLAAARAAAALAPGCRCVTLQGELLEADGALTVGEPHAGAGILSRKSELRDLRERQTALDRRLTELDRDVADLRERAAALDDRMGRQRLEIDVLADQSADLRGRIGQRRQRREGLHAEVQGSREEISGLEQEIRELDESWNRARGEAARAEGQVQALQARLEKAEREIREGDETRLRRQQEGTAAQVALAQLDERLTGLRQARAARGGPTTARGGAVANGAAAGKRTGAAGRERMDAAGDVGVAGDMAHA